MQLPTAQEMKDLDRSAMENFGIPSIVLMENAGLGTVRMIEKELGSCRNTFALIFVGPGNNGGDGLVIGRHLHQRGCQPLFFFLVNPDSLQGDAAVNLTIIRNLKLPFHVVDTPARVQTIPVLLKQFESRGLPCYAVIDAIFGIGLCRPVTGHFADTIDLINSANFCRACPVVAVDIPSGMDTDTGKIFGTCVQADYTATYGYAKPAHFIHGSSSWAGKLEIIDIGIPPEAIQQAKITTELATRENCTPLIASLTRKKSAHKGSHGNLLILAGSTGKTGAAILAARGALRGGAGLVNLLVPHDLNIIFETVLTEAMTHPLPNSCGCLSVDDWPTISEQLPTKQAIVIGPGIGLGPKTAELVLRIYHTALCPVIIDADALTVLASHQDRLAAPQGPRIFTPHPGELARLLNKSTTDIQENRLNAALSGGSLFLNSRHDTVMILKGAGTIIAASNGLTTINTTGNPGMATGGMGDVLTGIIGALVCQGLSPLHAAVAGVYLHGAAADCLFAQSGAGFLASEVADVVPLIIKEHLAG